MERPLVSIIVPIYNVEKYIDKCVTSLTKQTYKNLEIILINDGSSDKSAFVCEQWIKDGRVHVIHKENEGVSSARNMGLMQCKGEYIMFCDADDFYDLHMVERMLSDAINYSADIVFCGYRLCYNNGEADVISPKRTGLVDNEEAMIWALKKGGYFVSVWNKLYKKDICFNEQASTYIFFKDFDWGEDEVWLFEVLKNKSKIFLNSTPYYNWLVRMNSASRVNGITKERMRLIETGEIMFDISKTVGNKAMVSTSIAQFIKIYDILIEAYSLADKRKVKFLKNKLKKYRKQWLFSDESTLGKVKKLLVIIIITLRLPNCFVMLLDKRGNK